jgi:nucleotide-binding universal stress UspA family protein
MKILLGVDDSKFSEAALQAVIAQHRPSETEVRVLHVVQPISVSRPPQMSAQYAPELEDQVTQAQKFLDRAVQTLRRAGFKAQATVEKGDVRERIIDSASEWHADLIVVGSHGRGGLRRFLLGSVAEFVARHAPCSVEIVRLPVSQ